MKHFILKWFISTVALLIIVHIFSGVQSESLLITIVTALVLGLFNSFLKPILSLIALPLQILTLGVFTLVINALLFYLAAKLVHGFYVASFGTAFWAALVYSLVTILINSLIKSERE